MVGWSSQQGRAQFRFKASLSLLYIRVTDTSYGFYLVLNFQISPLLTRLSFPLTQPSIGPAYTSAVICQCTAQPPCFIGDFSPPPHWCRVIFFLKQINLDLVLQKLNWLPHQQKVPSWPVLISPFLSALPLMLGHLRTEFPESLLLLKVPVTLLMVFLLLHDVTHFIHQPSSCSSFKVRSRTFKFLSPTHGIGLGTSP